MHLVSSTPVVQQFESINLLFQQANGEPRDLTRQPVMHHGSWHGRLYNKDKTFNILEYVGFDDKLNKEISIDPVNLTSGYKNYEK